MSRTAGIATPLIVFGPFELDREAGALRRDGRTITLRPKAWQMLVHLAERPGVLVATEDLYAAVWGDTAVTPNAMTNVMGELRRALGDGAPPAFIETIRGRGYRFIARISEPPATATTPRSIAGFVGREAELAELRAAVSRAAGGARQAVFVSGEPGIGKTALVDQFAEGTPGLLRVQCSELGGASEAYQPLLSALQQLLRGERRDDVERLLHEVAPTWLVQLPSLLSAEEAQELARSLVGVGPARMLRDGAILFEQIAKLQPLVLVLEDLHWADPPTIELLSALLQRREGTCLLAVATYRPIDALVHGHPVSAMFAALQHHDNVRSLPLSAFSLLEVRRCLANELFDDALAAKLAPPVGRHSGGNPLFVKTIARQLREEGWLIRRSGKWELTVEIASFDPRLPDDLRELIELQLEQLPDDSQRLLEAASIATIGITAVLLRDALQWESERVEDICHALTQRSPYLRRVPARVTDGEPPEQQYGFTHALYLHAFRDRTAPSRRRDLSRRIGEFVERTHGGDPEEVAARLASYFEGAAMFDRASHYRELAAGVALRRLAYAEAVHELETALAHLDRAEILDVDARRARINLALGNTRLGLLGYAHPSVRSAFEQAEKAGVAAGDVRSQVRALSGLGTVTLNDGNLRAALAIVERQLEASAGGVIAQYSFLRAGHVHLMLGNLREAIAYLDRAAAVPPEPGIPMMIDARAEQESWRALTLVQLGSIDAAHAAVDAAIERASTVNLVWGNGTTIYLALETALLERNLESAARYAEELLANAARYELGTHVPIANFSRHLVRGLRRPNGPDLEAAREHYRQHEALQERWHRAVQLSHLAELETRCGRLEDATRTLDKTFEHAEWGGEERHLPELWRVRGEIALQSGAPTEATSCFRRAVDLALSKDSLLFALRSAVALARVSGDRAARDQLQSIRELFGETVPCADIREADQLLR